MGSICPYYIAFLSAMQEGGRFDGKLIFWRVEHLTMYYIKLLNRKEKALKKYCNFHNESNYNKKYGNSFVVFIVEKYILKP